MIKAPCKPIPAMDRLIRPLFAPLAAVTILFGLIGCGYFPMLEQQKPKEVEPVQAEAPKPVLPMEPQEVHPAKGTRWEWKGDKRKITHIWIDVDSQKARFYEGKEQVGWTYVASGVKTHPTPVGHFSVMGKEKTKESNLYGKIYNAEGRVVVSDAKRGRNQVPAGGRFAGAKMPNYLRLTGDGVGLHAGPIPRPGHPASHGCIRLPPPLAERLFAQVPIGTPVTITGSGPDYGDYRAKLAAKGPARLEPAEGGPMEPAEVAKAQPAPSPPVQNQPAQTQPAQTQPLSTRPTQAQTLPTPWPTQAEPVQSRSPQIQPTQPQITQPRPERSQSPQNQAWKPLVTEGKLAVPVGIQPINQDKQPSVVQPMAMQVESNPAVKAVPPQQGQGGSSQQQETQAPPQVTKNPTVGAESQLAGGQASPHHAPGAPAQDQADRALPSAAPDSGVQTAPAKASPESRPVPAPYQPPMAGQLQAKPAPAVQPLTMGAKAPESAVVKVPPENTALSVQAGKDQAQVEPAPAVPVQAEPGKTTGG